MDDGICGPADRRVDAHGIFERLARYDARNHHIVLHQIDDTAARLACQQIAARVDCRDGRIARQRHADRLD